MSGQVKCFDESGSCPFAIAAQATTKRAKRAWWDGMIRYKKREEGDVVVKERKFVGTCVDPCSVLYLRDYEGIVILGSPQPIRRVLAARGFFRK